MNYKSARYFAVVESGSCSADYERWEERKNCGHAHRTYEAAEACGAKHYDAKYVRGSWQANADWHGYTVHDQDGKRAQPGEEQVLCTGCGKRIPKSEAHYGDHADTYSGTVWHCKECWAVCAAETRE